MVCRCLFWESGFVGVASAVFVLGVTAAAGGSKLDARRAKLGALRSGLSAWSYWSGSPDIQKQIKSFNAKAATKNELRVNYVGAADVEVKKGLRFDKGGFEFVPYGKTEAKDMKRFQRKGLVLSVVGGIFEKGEFSGRTKEEYEFAGDKIADYIIRDRDTDGVQIDIEPIDETWLPLIRRLSERLHKAGKLSTCYLCPDWTCPGFSLPDDAIKELFELTDQVVLDCYSIVVTKPKAKRKLVEQYKTWLRAKLDRMTRLAAAGKGRLTIGVPASARRTKQFSDADALKYTTAAHNVIKDFIDKPGYSGTAMWLLAFTGSKDWQPITQDVWKETLGWLRKNQPKR